MSVRPKVGVLKPRPFMVLNGLTPARKIGVHVHALDNAVRALVERVYRVEQGGQLVPPPRPRPGIFRCLSGFGHSVASRIQRSYPWSQAEFLMSCTGAKRKVYERAAASLREVPVNADDAVLKSFIKHEKLDLEKKSDPAPRAIQPRSPRYNLEVGRYLKALEHRAYMAIDSVFGECTVAKGLNALDCARVLRKKWESFSDPVALGIDAKRFDQHVSSDALRWEHSVYMEAYGGDPKLRWLLDMQIHNKGTFRCPDGDIKYRVEGCRMSGDMNTSMGNVLLMCAMVHEFLRQIGVPAKLANNGDDCVLFFNRGDLRKVARQLPQWFLLRGFQMEVEDPAYEFEQIEFCQQRPVFDGSVWIMTRSPHKGLAKDVVHIRPNMGSVAKDYASWASSVGIAGLAAYGGIPVVQEVYLHMSRLGKGTREIDRYSGLGAAAHRMNRSYQTPTAAARASYCRAWGIEPSHQVLLEQAVRSATVDLNGRYIGVSDQTPISAAY